MSDAETPRLYKKGDKITVVYTVTQDEILPRSIHADRHIHVTADGQLSSSMTRRASFLDRGTLEPVPEPPYVPKVGDRFWFTRVLGNGPGHLCIFVDDKSIVYEHTSGSHRALADLTPGNFRKAD